MEYSNVVINLIGRHSETRLVTSSYLVLIILTFIYVFFSSSSNFSYDDVHVKIARTIARLARECGVQRLIHFSALNASPTPPPIIFGKPSRFLQSKVTDRLSSRDM